MEAQAVCLPGNNGLYGKYMIDLYLVNRDGVTTPHISWYLGRNRTCLSGFTKTR